MTTTFLEDPFDRRLVRGAHGLLATFNVAGVIDAADVHVAQRVTVLAGETDETVALALALTVRAVRGGSVCLDLATVAEEVAPLDPDAADPAASDPAASDSALSDWPRDTDLPWPEPDAWLAAVRASPLLGSPPVLHLEHERLVYLDRYWREETQVCEDLLSRPAATALDPQARKTLDAGLQRLFAGRSYEEQRAAADLALRQRTTVLTGGPGTGKTTTVAALLALFAEQAEAAGHGRLRVALAAPTGKASARLQQAVRHEVTRLDHQDQARLGPLDLHAVTLHRLLGSLRDSSVRFRHHRDNRLSHDVIVVDETSMVSLTMMARLLEAVRPETRLILVGDPDQLASVEAGAVLADLVEGLRDRPDIAIAELRTSHRYGESIGRLARAVRDGDGDAAVDLLRAGGDHVELAEEADSAPRLRALLLPQALRLREASLGGDALRALSVLEGQRLLCAHRAGPHGVHHWNRQVERWLSEETGEGLWSSWYAGRPLLVTANDYGLGVYNGDTGVTVRRPDGALRAAVAGTAGHLDLATSRLGQVETMHAMTIHKSQGSQADEVVVLLPPPESRLLTRELFYTALTRAQRRVVVVGSADDVRAAVSRRARRATGLRQRLADWTVG